MKMRLAGAGLLLLATGPAWGTDLVIGQLHAITGPSSYLGQPQSRAIQVGAEQVNAAGGITLGGRQYQIRIETGDDQASATAGVTAVKKLISSDVHFIIGPLHSAVASAIKPILDANPDVTLLIDGSIADNVVNGRNIFRNQTNADEYNDTAEKIAKAEAYPTVALLTDRVHAGFMNSEARMAAALKTQGSRLVAQEYYKTGDTDYSAQLTKIIGLSPAVIIVRGYAGESALITRQARQLGYKGAFIWEANAEPTVVRKNISDAEMQGVLNGVPPQLDYYIAAGDKRAIALDAAIRKRFGVAPGENTVLSYDAFNILVDAIRKADSTDPKAVDRTLAALRVSDVPELIGKYTPYSDGKLFHDGQAQLAAVITVWKGDGWQPVPGMN